MKKILRIGAITFLTFGLSSCATLFYGTSDKVRFESEPSGAEVIINGRSTNKKTPCDINVVRDNYTRGFSWTTYNYLNYELKMEGYTPVKDIIQAKKNPLFFIDFFCLLFFVDMSTESVYKYESTVNKKLILLNPEESK